MPIAENLPSGTAYRPADVVTFRNGKKAEITNTDAEGRVVLADAIARAAEDRPDVLLETSTLTGAQLVALGSRTAGVMGSDDLRDAVVAAAEARGEGMCHAAAGRAARGLDSPVADFVNANADRMGGMLVGGHFLAEFVPEGAAVGAHRHRRAELQHGRAVGLHAQGRHRRPGAHPARDHRGPHRRLTRLLRVRKRGPAFRAESPVIAVVFWRADQSRMRWG